MPKSEIVLIDNYVDDTVFTLLSKYPNLNIKIYTQTITKQQKVFESNIRASSPILEYQIPCFDEKYLCLNYLFTMDNREIKKLWKLLESEPKGKSCTTK
jgi:hypothetical protein